MIWLRKPAIVLVATAVAALIVVVAPATAKKPSGKKQPCWKVLVNDWYDGTINGKYAPRCYRDALRRLKGDTYALGYTSAYDDINRALQRRLAELARQKQRKHSSGGGTSQSGGGSTGQSGGVAPPSGGGSSGKGPSGGTAAPPTPPPTAPPTAPPAAAPPNKSGKHKTAPGNKSQPKPPPQSSPVNPGSKRTSPPSTRQPDLPPGRDSDGKGPAQKLIKKLGPDDATSIPIPLIVLAGVAVLLMAAGAASLIARRAQQRRTPVAVRSVPPARGR
jgi:hypothetical protein